MRNRTDALFHTIFIYMNDQIQVPFLGDAISEFDHLAEFPCGIHMQDREGRWRRIKRLPRQMQHHHGILADGKQHHRIAALGGHFPDDTDAFRFQTTEMR
ncbi:hypothetical protein JCM17845_12860 [Iodidimonas gelatinilytica]|uniref:Uncharacterized protein n=1 Tax=Iodidimonas gelatinilytica TaxID=1236966 RepID=A0A5A7MX65_9PROT|nr:hypothetical protein JCM17845_12860 [Iodidimonas gelatinilytica]